MVSTDQVAMAALVVLNLVYLCILSAPVETDMRHRRFVLRADSRAAFELMVARLNNGSGGYKYDDDFRPSGGGDTSLRSGDDFYLNDVHGGGSAVVNRTIVPSSSVLCEAAFVSIRSEETYKYLCAQSDAGHAGSAEELVLAAAATFESPLLSKAFELRPVNGTCAAGWVLLRAVASPRFLYMVPPASPMPAHAWTVRTGLEDEAQAAADERYWFLLERDGYVLNKGSMAFLNNMYGDGGYSIRGHSAQGDRSLPAYREYGAAMAFKALGVEELERARAQEQTERAQVAEQRAAQLRQIAALPPSLERRVLSFGLYGADPKYTQGAVRNAELRDTFFPGWVCRFYVTDDVPLDVLARLKELGAEVLSVPQGQGRAAGMFFRFLVAADPSVDRFVVRDVDSRLNARDRLAVQDWVDSGAPSHVMRDHVNHCSAPMNGGMWGAVRGALPSLGAQLDAWPAKDAYAADLDFLAEKVWPELRHTHVAHDSYCCDRFPRTRPFPSRRPLDYQHVGQVFDALDRPRMSDIDGFIRGVPVPVSCRKEADWIYG